ncbi:hypothetical protein HDV05_001812 [Chytridiales sp. JEL 0842]|nr:hypothetical protein HDV05_001812 [Chytridiales sp. JEL 0842]
MLSSSHYLHLAVPASSKSTPAHPCVSLLRPLSHRHLKHTDLNSSILNCSSSHQVNNLDCNRAVPPVDNENDHAAPSALDSFDVLQTAIMTSTIPNVVDEYRDQDLLFAHEAASTSRAKRERSESESTLLSEVSLGSEYTTPSFDEDKDVEEDVTGEISQTTREFEEEEVFLADADEEGDNVEGVQVEELCSLTAGLTACIGLSSPESDPQSFILPEECITHDQLLSKPSKNGLTLSALPDLIILLLLPYLPNPHPLSCTSTRFRELCLSTTARLAWIQTRSLQWWMETGCRMGVEGCWWWTHSSKPAEQTSWGFSVTSSTSWASPTPGGFLGSMGSYSPSPSNCGTRFLNHVSRNRMSCGVLLHPQTVYSLVSLLDRQAFQILQAQLEGKKRDVELEMRCMQTQIDEQLRVFEERKQNGKKGGRGTLMLLQRKLAQLQTSLSAFPSNLIKVNINHQLQRDKSEQLQVKAVILLWISTRKSLTQPLLTLLNISKRLSWLLPEQTLVYAFGLGVAESRTEVVKILFDNWPEQRWDPTKIPNWVGIACRRGNLSLVKFLIEIAGFDPSASTTPPIPSPSPPPPNPKHPTTTTLQPHLSNLLSTLHPHLQHPTLPSHPLLTACKHSNEPLVRYLLAHPTTVITPPVLVAACMGGSARIFKLVTSQGWTWGKAVWEDCLLAASSCGNLDVVNLLLVVGWEKGWEVGRAVWEGAVGGGFEGVARVLKAEMSGRGSRRI